MLSFCGIDQCSVDANGRIKLSPRVIEDFAARGGEVVLHCLPEGAIAVYPEDVYLAMRKNESNPAEKAAESIVFRRTLRRFGGWSQSEKISAQSSGMRPPKTCGHSIASLSFLTRPESGAIMPAIIEARVLLPTPFGPAITVQPAGNDSDRDENNAHPEPGYENEISSSCRSIVTSSGIKRLAVCVAR